MLIRQRQKADCGLCCLAMLTGRTWEDVRATVGDAWTPRRGLVHCCDALERLGFVWDDDGPNGYLRIVGAPALISPWLLWGRRALMSVPSLNQNGMHMVYWDGRKLWDPTTKKARTKLLELRPESVYVFMEGAHATPV